MTIDFIRHSYLVICHFDSFIKKEAGLVKIRLLHLRKTAFTTGPSLVD